MKLQLYIRNRVSGAPVAGLAVPLKRHSDNSVITTATSDANGFVTFLIDGHPGDVFAEVTQGGETRIVSSRTTGPTGFFQAGEAGEIMQVMGSGVVSGVANTLVVAAGSALTVTVGTGLALLADHQYRQYTVRTITLAGADATNPRIDLIVARVVRATGVSAVMTLTGTPGATPVPVAPVQNAGVWDEPLAQVLVGAGATTLSADKITDRRRYATTLVGDGAVTASKLAPGAVTSPAISTDAVTATHIAAGAVGASEIAPLAVGLGKIAAGAVGTPELGNLQVTGAKIVDGTIGDAKLATGIGGAKLAAGTVPETALTSAVQTKLNAPSGSAGQQTLTIKDSAAVIKTNPSELNFQSPGFTVSPYSVGQGVDIFYESGAVIRAVPDTLIGTSLGNTSSTTGVAVLSTSIVIPNDGRTYDVLAWGSLGFFNSVNVWSGIQLSVGGVGAGYVGGAGATYRDKSQQLTVLGVAPGNYSVIVALKTTSGTVNYDGGQVSAVAVPR